MESLHNIGIKYGTDKATYHNYLNFYEQKIGNLRKNNINLLEIGFLRGDSIKMWLDYFENAHIYCIDIIDCYFIHERFHYLKISQDDLRIKEIFNDESFDVIIDDGSHMTYHQLKSLEILWGKLKNGGFYILEDLHTSFREEYINTKITPYEVLNKEKTLPELNNIMEEAKNIEIYRKDKKSNYDSLTSIIQKWKPEN